MNKKDVLLILWIIFGFIFINGLDSILKFLTYLVYFAKSELGLSYRFMTYSMPITTLILYITTTALIFKNFKMNSTSSRIDLTKFPKKTCVVFAIITLTLNPLTQKLSGLYIEYANRMGNIAGSEFLQFYGAMTSGMYISKWVVLICLAILFMKKLNGLENRY